RLLLARRALERRMAMLGARLSREEHELLRAHAFRVHVDDELQPDLLELPEPEVCNLQLFALGRREHDARVREHLRRFLARLGVRHSETVVPFVADSCSAWSA